MEWAGLETHLLPEKALFWPSEGILALADLHLGKVNHFRRSGVPVPLEANRVNMENLMQLIMLHRPGRVVFLGDLFHSHYNSEWEVVGNSLMAFPEIEFILIRGNHDILGNVQYQRHRIRVTEEFSVAGKVVLRHDAQPDDQLTGFQVCGHVHPAITLRGTGLASETFPCFWFGAQTAIMPAFGAFTGLKRIKPKRGDRLYIIAEGCVTEVS